MRSTSLCPSPTSLRAVLAALCMLLASASLQAQVGKIFNDFAVGVNGGYVLDKMSFNPTIKQNWHGGTTFGLSMRYTCEQYFSAYCALQVEANFAQLGWKELIETSTDTYERTINYVQVPFLARLSWGKYKRGAMGYLILGPQVGFYINDHDKRGTSDGSEGWTSTTLYKRPNHITQQYDLPVQNSFEYGITGGLGMEVNTVLGHFQLEGRYYYGLSDIFHNSKKDKFGKSSHGAIIAKVSYMFDLKKKKNKKAAVKEILPEEVKQPEGVEAETEEEVMVEESLIKEGAVTEEVKAEETEAEEK